MRAKTGLTFLVRVVLYISSLARALVVYSALLQVERPSDRSASRDSEYCLFLLLLLTLLACPPPPLLCHVE